MKVLWFSHVDTILPSAAGSVFCGWIGSLLDAIHCASGIELGVAAFSDESPVTTFERGVSYYGMRHDHSRRSQFLRIFNVGARDRSDLTACLRVVDAFHPDLIHIFGTEGVSGLLCLSQTIPVVLHLQGLLTPYINAWLPPFYSVRDLMIRAGATPLHMIRQWHAWRFNRHAAFRELDILRSCRFVMGRTDWDKAYVSLYAPQARYFHCEEALRPEFLAPCKRRPPSAPVFLSTLSGPLYKGHDVILKTAKVLCETGHGDFEWRVFGVDNIRFAEWKTGIRAADVRVRPMGRIPASRLRDELLGCTVYVHPSYIDNSPNSVCEAQVLGVPVIATNVGGVSSIVEAGKTGFLVPANDPIALAKTMLDVTSGSLYLPDGWQAEPRARHDPANVTNRVLEIYRKVCSISSR